MIISLDTETTGINPFHGSQPFIVSMCDGGDPYCFEWEVDPLTRRPVIPDEDVITIAELVDSAEKLILQNAKFDVKMLETIHCRPDIYSIGNWPWHKTYDTLLASHLLNSFLPKGLAYRTAYHLGLDIGSYEEKMKDVVHAARRLAKKEFPDWRIAADGLEDMPSAKTTVWKYDCWLPRAVHQAMQGIIDGSNKPRSLLGDRVVELFNDSKASRWATVTSDYACADADATWHLWAKQEQLLKEQGLWKIYQQRLKVLPIAYNMEETGVTINSQRLSELAKQYVKVRARSVKTCCNIAKSYKYNLSIPKTGNNNSLLEFAFNVLKLEPKSRSKKTGRPSLDKATLRAYEEELPNRTKAGLFIRNLADIRKRSTALSYIDGYRRFMLPLLDNRDTFAEIDCVDRGPDKAPEWYVLHPSLNPTGTRTLRWSSQNPNEQNISKQEGFNLRYAFGPAPGREWWSLDYENLELRIPAYECQEPAMLELFERPDDPPYFGSYHLLIFSILYPKEFGKYGDAVKDRYKSTLYQWTKNGNFAELYGAIDTGDGKSTADRAFHYPGAQAIVSKRLQQKSELNRKWIAYANKHGCVETMPDRTVDPNRGYPLQLERGKWGKISPTEPLNYRVQGTAMWIIQQAMIKVAYYLGDLPDYRMVMQVHDELDFDFPYKPNKGNLPKINRIKQIMESIGNDLIPRVPLRVGVSYHPNNWSESV